MKKIFFTGHRAKTFYHEDMSRLAKLLSKLISEGAEDFYVGGAFGWDCIFETYILIRRKTSSPNIKLHLVLPCPPEEQTKNWIEEDKEKYQDVLDKADSVEIVSPHYDKSCMKKRNERLAELGDVCVCYYNKKRARSGTGQTVRMAEKMGKKIINIYVERTEH